MWFGFAAKADLGEDHAPNDEVADHVPDGWRGV